MVCENSILDTKYKDLDLDLFDRVMAAMGKTEVFSIKSLFQEVLEFQINCCIYEPGEEEVKKMDLELKEKTIGELLSLLKGYFELLKINNQKYSQN